MNIETAEKASNLIQQKKDLQKELNILTDKSSYIVLSNFESQFRAGDKAYCFRKIPFELQKRFKEESITGLTNLIEEIDKQIKEI